MDWIDFRYAMNKAKWCWFTTASLILLVGFSFVNGILVGLAAAVTGAFGVLNHEEREFND